MTDRIRIIVVLLSVAAAFAIGRYSARPPAVDKTTESHTKTDTQIDKEEHKKTVIVTDKDGNTTTTITDDTHTQTDRTSAKDKETTLVVTPPKGILNVSALAAFNYRDAFQPVYGLSVTKEIIGPFTAGAFGLSNGTIGLSVGINF